MRLRCPHCKDITSEHGRTFPHCRGCGRQLAECRYCLHFDAHGGLCRSPHLDRPTPVDPHAVPTCGQYRSRLDPDNLLVRRALRIAVPAAAVAAALALAFFGYRWIGARVQEAGSQTATLAFAASDSLPCDTPTTFYVTITNTGRKPVRDLELRLSADLLDACELVSFKPAHRHHVFNAQQRAHCYSMGPLGRSATLTVELTVKPRSTRFCILRCRAEARGDAGQTLAQATQVMQVLP